MQVKIRHSKSIEDFTYNEGLQIGTFRNPNVHMEGSVNLNLLKKKNVNFVIREDSLGSTHKKRDHELS